RPLRRSEEARPRRGMGRVAGRRVPPTGTIEHWPAAILARSASQPRHGLQHRVGPRTSRRAASNRSEAQRPPRVPDHPPTLRTCAENTMKVLAVSSYGVLGGAELALAEFMRHRPAGVEVRALLVEDGPLRARLAEHEVPSWVARGYEGRP